MGKQKVNVRLNNWKEIVLLISVGFGIGFINGFLGAGGGILLVPALTFLVKEPIKVAHATAIVIILPLCVASGIVYIVKGFYDFGIGWKILVGTLLGGVLGTVLLKKLANNWISLIFASVMIVAGVYLCVR